MFSSFKQKTPPPGAIRVESGQVNVSHPRIVAFIGDREKDSLELQDSFKSQGVIFECYTSDHWQTLIDDLDKYNVVLIDFSLGNGIMSIAINETLLRHAYKGRMFLLAHDSMEIYNQDYSTVLMMDAVKDNPMRVFNGKEITNADIVSETVFMKKSIANGRRK